MSWKLVLFVATIATSRTVRAGGESGTHCSNSDHESRSCSPVEVPDRAVSELIQSLMAINVNRTGLKRLGVTKFDEPVPPMEGPLSPNSKLDQNTERKFPFLHGAESLSTVGNFLYAAAANAIHRIDLLSGQSEIVYDGNAKCSSEKPCSRPLGIRIKGDRLLCADSLKGLIEVNLTTGESTVHIAIGSPINGIPLLFPDDIDVDWENDIVYMSDASTKWPFESCLWSILESDSSSRIIRLDLRTGKANLFAQNIRFANGVQITHDKKFLLVSEFSARRILKYPLDDSLPASAKSFTGLLPGTPDNIRPSSTGGYWVGLPFVSVDGSPSFLEKLQARPDLGEKFGNSALTIGSLVESMGKLLSNDPLRALGQEVQTGMILVRTLHRRGIVLELDADGNIKQSLQSTQTSLITEVCEHENGLFCGSFANKFVLSVPKANFRNA